MPDTQGVAQTPRTVTVPQKVESFYPILWNECPDLPNHLLHAVVRVVAGQTATCIGDFEALLASTIHDTGLRTSVATCLWSARYF